MTLTEFLAARLDEDEERAGSGWSRSPEGRWECDDYGRSLLTPRAVLAEVEAKRRVMALAADQERMRVDDWDVEVEGAVDVMCQTLRLLALPYADHPDYDESWRP